VESLGPPVQIGGERVEVVPGFVTVRPERGIERPPRGEPHPSSVVGHEAAVGVEDDAIPEPLGCHLVVPGGFDTAERFRWTVSGVASPSRTVLRP
jgi:hypothetical protein